MPGFLGLAALGLMLPGARAAHRSPKATLPHLFVATTGTDTSTCTKSSPCASFGRAYRVAAPGQVIEVAGGTYGPQTILNDPRKTSGPNVVIRAAAGATVNLVGPPQGDALRLGINSDDPSAASPSFLTISGIHAVGGLSHWTGSTRIARQSRSITLQDSSFSDVRSRIGPLITFRYVDNLKVIGNDIGPVCCGTDGLNLANAGAAGSDPSNVLIDHNYIHDETQTCATNPDPSCTNDFHCPANTAVCDHPDGSQFFGVRGLMLSNNRYYNAGTQNIFLQSANGGTFSDLTFQNNMVATTAGPGVTNSVSLSGPGRGTFSGYVRVLDNTIQKNLLIYDTSASNRVLAPGTKVTFLGNIIGFVGDDTGAARCGFVANDGSQITPDYGGNLFGNKTCAPSDRRGVASFASTDPLKPDLHLARGSLGIGIAEKKQGPATDIDGEQRPRLLRPDAGADQREPASVRPGIGIGAVRIGERQADVEAFYGNARGTPKAQFLRRAGVRTVVYRVHRGALWIGYRNGSVAAVGTNSGFYQLGGVTVGSTLAAARTLGGLGWIDCRRAYAARSRTVKGVRLYVEPTGRKAGAHVAAIWLITAASDGC